MKILNCLVLLGLTVWINGLDCAAAARHDSDGDLSTDSDFSRTTTEVVPQALREGLTEAQLQLLQSRHGHVYGAASKLQTKEFADTMSGQCSSIWTLEQLLQGGLTLKDIAWACSNNSTEFSQVDQATIQALGVAKANEAYLAATSAAQEFASFLNNNRAVLGEFARQLREANRKLLAAQRIYQEAASEMPE